MTTSPTNGQPLEEFVQNQVNNPTLPAGGTMTPTLMQDSADTTMTGTGTNLAPTSTATQAAPTTVNTAAGQATVPTGTTPTAQQVTTPTQAAGQTYTPTTVLDRYTEMMQQFEGGETPDWAKGAVKTATQQMNARGLGASTMAGEATTTAIMEAAKPIAMADAQIMNAAKQFNAQSIQQATQFWQTLQSNIELDNAKRTDAMGQFNRNVESQLAAVSANNQKDLEVARANLTNDVNKFNATMADAREKFNASNQLVIEQSNVQWRRMINTNNTAAQNAANQLNVQNQFNMSQWALAALWQQARDEASWANTAAENEKQRAHNIAVAAIGRDAALTAMSVEQRNNVYSAIGTWAAGALSGWLGS